MQNFLENKTIYLLIQLRQNYPWSAYDATIHKHRKENLTTLIHFQVPYTNKENV